VRPSRHPEEPADFQGVIRFSAASLKEWEGLLQAEKKKIQAKKEEEKYRFPSSLIDKPWRCAFWDNLGRARERGVKKGKKGGK